jgi:D-alanyl-D-alanine carboxypeptidase (penicillin-binding protein 5/6)
MKRCIHILLLVALVVPMYAQEEGPAAAKGVAVDTTGKGYTAAYVIDANSGRVLFAENEHQPLPTASMAKMMTLLLTLEAIKNGELTMDTPVTISARATGMGGSQVYLKAGSVWPLKNLVIATMVHSANDAAQALAEKVAGSTEAFVNLMNRRAEELGLTDSKFFDPHGLPAKDPSRNDVMSAHDLAILGQELMKYPAMRTLAMIPEMEFRNGTLERIYNPNRLINPKRAEYYDASTGIKTGYSDPAGYSVTSSARRNNMELIGVVMGARTPVGPQSSFGLMSRLFNHAFVEYRNLTPLKKGAVVGQASVSDGASKTVPAVAPADVNALVKRGQEKNVKVSFAGNAVTAPVRAGQEVGKIVVQSGGEEIARIPAVAATAVAKQSAWRKLWPF